MIRFVITVGLFLNRYLPTIAAKDVNRGSDLPTVQLREESAAQADAIFTWISGFISGIKGAAELKAFHPRRRPLSKSDVSTMKTRSRYRISEQLAILHRTSTANPK